MNKKTIYIIVAVLVIIIIAAAAAYMYTTPGGGGEATPTPTATPLTVVGATSLQFTVDETTSGGSPVTYDYAVRNFNASNEELRVDIPGGSAGNYSYIIKLVDSTSFLSIDNGVTWTASDFATDAAFATFLNDYVTALYNWNGHDATYTYTSGDITNVISALHINPTLPDSMFATS
jgi:uncharacterized protein YxeA